MLTGRTPSAAEAPAIAALLDECAAAYGSARLDATEIASWFASPQFEPEDFRVLEAGGRLVGYADLSLRPPSDAAWLDLRAAPAAPAEPLLEWAEARARERGAARLRAMSFAGSDEEPLRQRGYEPIRRFFELEIALGAGLSDPAWPEGIAVRASLPGEEERVHSAVEEAFADHWENEPRPFETWLAGWRAIGYDASLWFLALDGDEIAAVCLCHVRGPEVDREGWIDDLATRRPWRRRGIGAALLQHAFREFRGRGLARAGLDVDGENTTGAVRLYERVGMHPATQRICWDLPLG